MMNKELKTKWLEALRSGEYKQSREILKDENGFCCLGVLCDLTHPDAWVGYKGDGGIWKYHSEANTYTMEDDYGEPLKEKSVFEDAELADDLLYEFGLTEKEQRILINKNDTDKWTFNQIADWIEENL